MSWIALNDRASRGLLTLTCLAGLTIGVVATPTATLANAPQTIEAVAARSYDLARSGRLDDVWRGVMQLDADNPAVERLQNDVTAYLDRRTLQNQADAKVLEYKLDQLSKHAAEGKTVKALTAAVEAYPLADDPNTVLSQPRVQKLVARAETEAAGYEAEGRWLKALELYNRLDMLFHRQNRYVEQIDRVDEQIALLRLYAPNRLYEMYARQAKENGEVEPEPWNVEPDEWQDHVRDI
ncbi:MAG: hypothetical protein ACYTGQ_14370, partial [Planctomycetota bacterium]